MHRRIPAGVVALLAAAATLGASTGTAQAAASCSVHGVAITQWSAQGPNPSVQGGFDFKCGGSTTNYRLQFNLQELVGGTFEAVLCNGSFCTVFRPSQSSFYGMGTEHGSYPNSDWAWNPDDPQGLSGQTMRIKAIVIFANGDPSLTYYSSRITF